MAKKSSETLEEGLNRSANKRGFSGKERHRYIGGAIRNMEKRGTVHAKKRTASAPKNKPQLVTPKKKPTYTKPTVTKVVKKAAYSKPTVTKREHLKLTVKRNAEASQGKPYDLYSIYQGTKQYSPATYRKRTVAQAEAKSEMSAHNDIRGPHTRGRLA